MPNAPPRNAIQSGMPAGSDSPSRRPVITAEPSCSDRGRPSSRSVMRAPAVAAVMTSSALTPKNHADAATTGTRLPTTFHMMRGVESPALRCGDAVTMSLGAFMPAPACAARRSATLLAWKSCDSGMFDGHTYAHEPQSMQSAR